MCIIFCLQNRLLKVIRVAESTRKNICCLSISSLIVEIFSRAYVIWAIRDQSGAKFSHGAKMTKLSILAAAFVAGAGVAAPFAASAQEIGSQPLAVAIGVTFENPQLPSYDPINAYPAEP